MVGGTARDDPTTRFLAIRISRFCDALFVRRLRRSRGDEFLEARIIPKRIEHWIEPEQRRSERRNLSEKFGLLFWRERGDDFLEARIAAERVPGWLELQQPIA